MREVLPWRALLFGALFLLAAGCSSEPTQIIVTIDGDASLVEAAVEVQGVEEARTSIPTSAGEGLPLTLTLVHGGGGLGPFTVAAIGFDVGGAEVARDCAATSFRDEATVEVALTLAAGTFVDCDGLVPDAGVGGDGGAPDGGVSDGGGSVDGGSCDPTACAMTDPDAMCIDGRCTITNCSGNTEDCYEAVAGCETNTNVTEAHCGGCFMPCAVGATCNGGNCPRP